MVSYPRREAIEFERTSDVTANDEVIGGDFDDIDGGPSLSSKEIFEVERIEIIPPTNDDGTLDTFDRIRLHDGADYYPFINYRSFMLGFTGPSFKYSTPRLGQSVLEGVVDPNNRPLLTATPKFGPGDDVHVAVQNDGTAIDQDFVVRVIGWRFKGTDREFQSYLSSRDNLSPTVNQNISISNPFDEEGETFSNETVVMTPGGQGGALTQFTHLSGGVNQNFPKIWPWATWSTNLNATEANKDYEFSYTDDNVDDKFQSLFFNFADGGDAAVFDYLMVDESVANLDRVKMELESRDEEDIPQFDASDTDQHELPFLRRLDGTVAETTQRESSVGGSVSRPVRMVTGVPRRISDLLNPSEAIVWNDEGGIVAVDDGNSIAANEILVGVQGNRLEMEG